MSQQYNENAYWLWYIPLVTVSDSHVLNWSTEVSSEGGRFGLQSYCRQLQSYCRQLQSYCRQLQSYCRQLQSYLMDRVYTNGWCWAVYRSGNYWIRTISRLKTNDLGIHNSPSRKKIFGKEYKLCVQHVFRLTFDQLRLVGTGMSNRLTPPLFLSGEQLEVWSDRLGETDLDTDIVYIQSPWQRMFQ